MSSVAQHWPNKDPDSVLDYSIDWSRQLELDDDEIDSVDWTIPAGLTLDSQLEANGIATAWISGGTAGFGYVIGCRMTTVGGRVYDLSVWLGVVER